MNTIHRLSVDIETFSDVDIGKTGLYKYAESPAFSVLLFAYSLDGQSVVVLDLTTPGARLPDELVSPLYPSMLKSARLASASPVHNV